MKRLGITLAGMALAITACTEDAAGPSGDELALAQEAQLLVEQEVAARNAHYLGWLGRLTAALRNTDDPEARAFLEQAREYRRLAAEAHAEGDFEEARVLYEMAYRSVLAAVIELFPEAPDRAGALVDAAVARIEDRLGDRDAPRIRRIIAHVRELRTLADEVNDPVIELSINLRAAHILHRLVHFVRFVRDHEHDLVAVNEMNEVPY